MDSVARLHKKKVEQAGFLVLKSPDIPSLLIETGFISNPNEARKLKKSSYQQEMASAIFNGLQSYYRDHPPHGTLLASRNNLEVVTHVVVSGDTLSEIAEDYDVSLSALLRHNAMSSASIRVGQKIFIPME